MKSFLKKLLFTHNDRFCNFRTGIKINQDLIFVPFCHS